MLLLLVGLLAAAAAKGSSLVVTVSGAPGEVEVTLQRWNESGRNADLAHRRLGRGESSSVFGDLEAGTYAVVVRGETPLAVTGMKINVGTAQRQRAAIAIRPVQVEGRALFGGKPLAGATLTFANTAVHWRAEVTTDAAGRFAAELWQPGEALVTASGGALTGSFTETAELHAGRVDIAVPDRQIGGRLFDAASGRGVPHVLVFLRTTHGDASNNVHTTTDANGAFLFNAVAVGAQHVTAVPPDFVIPEPVDFTTKEGDPPRQLDIALDSGAPRALRVFLHDGRPAAGAEVDAVARGEVRGIAVTDAAGRATVPLPRDAETKIYVVPREGPFTVVGARDSDRVDLPRPSSALRIVVRSTDGEPVPNVEMLMSLNGVVVPPAMARRMKTVQGQRLVTNAEGELVLRNIAPGWYQFWPYRGEEEAAAILASESVEAPIALNVKTGENTVAVDFQKQH